MKITLTESEVKRALQHYVAYKTGDPGATRDYDVVIRWRGKYAVITSVKKSQVFKAVA